MHIMPFLQLSTNAGFATEGIGIVSRKEVESITTFSFRISPSKSTLRICLLKIEIEGT